MSGWLHNMSVPPRSTITVARQLVPGRRFCVSFRNMWVQAHLRSAMGSTPLEWANRHGIPAALALLANDGPEAVYEREVVTRAAELAHGADPARLVAIVDERIEAAGLPATLGVFVDGDAASPDDVRLDAGTALAVLTRRSGPLYVPTRTPQLALVVPCHATLVFPLEFSDVA